MRGPRAQDQLRLGRPPCTSLGDQDAQKPTQARVYDYLVGGRDNFEADRELAGDLIRRHPPVARLARVNRGFVLAAARWAAERGVRQFLDLGCGLPLRACLA